MLYYVVLCCLMLSYVLKHVLATRVLFCIMVSFVGLCCLVLSIVVQCCFMLFYVVLWFQTIVGHAFYGLCVVAL